PCDVRRSRRCVCPFGLRAGVRLPALPPTSRNQDWEEANPVRLGLGQGGTDWDGGLLSSGLHPAAGTVADNDSETLKYPCDHHIPVASMNAPRTPPEPYSKVSCKPGCAFLVEPYGRWGPMLCWKCGRPLVWNGDTGRYNHAKAVPPKEESQ